MRLVSAFAAALLCWAPSLSYGYCFSIYTPGNELIYRSTETPIDLSQQISVGLRARYPNHHLVFVPDQSTCTQVGTLASVENRVRIDQGSTAARQQRIASRGARPDRE